MTASDCVRTLGEDIESDMATDLQLTKEGSMATKPAVLVTGGAGFIGAHTLLDLLAHGFRVVVLDNLDNSAPAALERVRQVSGCQDVDLEFVEVDLVDLVGTREAIKRRAPFAGCVHFAGFKAVGESVTLPWHYYYNNLVGTMNLLAALKDVECYSLVFSSSATVYGVSPNSPLREDEALGATNPYGHTKVQIEQILRDVGRAPGSKWRVALLRYFNPVGAHPSGRMGEDPRGVPNNLLPFVAQVAVGRRDKVSVFGSDYPTPDGTGVRDYIHVVDLARAHVAALDRVTRAAQPGTVEAYNVGTGRGSSVLDVIRAFEKASGKKIPYVLAPRRAGDVATSFCDPSKAERELGFKTKLTLDDACKDAWRWQQQNPYGYQSASTGEESPRKAVVFRVSAP